MLRLWFDAQQCGDKCGDSAHHHHRGYCPKALDALPCLVFLAGRCRLPSPFSQSCCLGCVAGFLIVFATGAQHVQCLLTKWGLGQRLPNMQASRGLRCFEFVAITPTPAESRDAQHAHFRGHAIVLMQRYRRLQQLWLLFRSLTQYLDLAVNRHGPCLFDRPKI